MADPNPSHRDRSTDDSVQRQDQPDIIDAEVVDDVVDDTPPSQSRNTADDDAFRQYQQFLEFQKFQEWQRSRADGDLPPEGAGSTPPRPGRPGGGAAPWWKRPHRVLRYKFARRLLYLLLILLLINWAIDHYFGDSGSSGGSGSGTGTGGAPPQANPITSTNPKAAIRGVYNYLAHKPDTACALFTDSGKAAFAHAYGAVDCEAAAQQAHRAATDPGSYANPKFGPDAVRETPTQAIVDSCAAHVQGGPPLGRFQLSKAADGGWVIDNYEPPKC